jgi:hypothetical protein
MQAPKRLRWRGWNARSRHGSGPHRRGRFEVRDLADALGVLSEWTQAGLQSTCADYPATAALFTGGEAAMMINGVQEVATMTDLAAQGKPFNGGAVELPVIFDQPSTHADSRDFFKEIGPEPSKAPMRSFRKLRPQAVTARP